MEQPVSLRSARKSASYCSETRFSDGFTNKHRRFRVTSLQAESSAADFFTGQLTYPKGGDPVYPLDALRLAGIDMASPEPVERALGILAGLIDRLDTLVGPGSLT